ncbi:MAG: phenylacetate--CoA ligase family protein, partial [Gammaproteobacteria bacterium]|nr:phenylacetate--CoA ligase family protein [Gammaproteobacteria bacterium]
RSRTRLAELVAHAVRHSPMHAQRFAGRAPEGIALSEFPVSRKADLMRHFDAWVTDPALRLANLRRFVADPRRIAEPWLGRYIVWESSGSSGEPGIFVQDAAAMAVNDALEAIRRPSLRPWQRLLDPLGLADQIAFVGAIGGHFASTVSVERIRRTSPAQAKRLHQVSFLQPLDALVRELDHLRPDIVATYPSVAVLLAQERLAGRLHFAPAEIWTGGENFSKRARTHVQQAFGCPVSHSYGASEFLALASECEHGGMHFNSDWAILEPVDEHGHPVAEGGLASTTLLTNLANHVQPLLRYDIGDRVSFLPHACACGSALPLIAVDGRCEETLVLGRGSAKRVHLLPLALTTVLEDDAGLFDFQLVQRGPCDLTLSSRLGGEAGRRMLKRACDALHAYLAKLGATGVRIRSEPGQAARVGRSGKAVRVLAERMPR